MLMRPQTRPHITPTQLNGHEHCVMQERLGKHNSLLMVMEKPPAGEKSLPTVTLYLATDNDSPSSFKKKNERGCFILSIEHEITSKDKLPIDGSHYYEDVIKIPLPSALTPKEQEEVLHDLLFRMIPMHGNDKNLDGRLRQGLQEIHEEIANSVKKPKNDAALAEHFNYYVDKGFLERVKGKLGGRQYQITEQGIQALEKEDKEFRAALETAQEDYGDKSFTRTLNQVRNGRPVVLFR